MLSTASIIARRVVTQQQYPRVPRLLVQRCLSSEAATAPTAVKLNFSLPHETIYKDKEVSSVIIPGV
jgi:hypothetical protein